jgi:DNA polymerase I-like protein with 3'-5' exonuclease and polymerase domains
MFMAVGGDARNRVLLSPFGSKTGRNQPSNSRFIFGPSAWLRSLIKPALGRAVAYVDWSQQELAIAAALSGDRAMQESYLSGDFYLSFAKRAGAVPPAATKQSHPVQREQFKTVSLGVLYGLSGEGLALKLGLPTIYGRDLLRMHKDVFRQFWKWSDMVQDQGMLAGGLTTVFGWQTHLGRESNPRSIRNFPMQGNGAEMMRVACCLATEEGITVCCPVHDALLIESDADEIDTAVSRTQEIMQTASEIVLAGFGLRTEAKIVRHPERHMDPRGEVMWYTVMELCGRLGDE